MIPYVSWRGVRLDASCNGTLVFWLTCRTAFSNRDRDPYGLTALPSALGSGAGAPARERQATTAALHAAPRPRNQRRDRVESLYMLDILQGVCDMLHT